MSDKALNICFEPCAMPPKPKGYRAVDVKHGIPVDLAKRVSLAEARMGRRHDSPFWVDKTGWTRADYFEHLARMEQAIKGHEK